MSPARNRVDTVASSFFALLDDIAVLAKAAAASVDDVMAGAAKASAKATGVVIDDAAVTPQYVRGITPQRELPVIRRITRGSLINKALIVAAIMVLSIWAPWVFPWLLIIGGSYLAFEGAEKVWHWLGSLRGARLEPTVEEVVERTPADERQIVTSAVRTDLVLSTEIMLISLANIDSDTWGQRLAILIVVALLMTVGVYGVVALLVKMDDVGMWLAKRTSRIAGALGSGLVHAMPWVFRLLSVVGVVAMLWVGGHILLQNLDLVGVPWPYAVAHAITHLVPGSGAFSAVAAWFVDSGVSAIFGLAWGSVIAAVVTGVAALLQRRHTRASAEAR